MKGRALGPTVATTKAVATLDGIRELVRAQRASIEAMELQPTTKELKKFFREELATLTAGGAAPETKGWVAAAILRGDKLHGDKKYCAVARKLRGSKERSNSDI